MFKCTIDRLLAAFICGAMLCLAERAAAQKPKVDWKTVAVADSAKQLKPVLIDLYTTWCGWCKVMDKKTYTNRELAAYVNEKFYAVKYDAESKAAIKWKGRTFMYSPAYKVNEFAVFLTKGQLAFPTTVIIPADGSEPQAIAGYLKPQDMELILKYFGDDTYKKMSFDAFQKQLKRSW
jgi:uncharacterized protein YyaL (SSP411 family)